MLQQREATENMKAVVSCPSPLKLLLLHFICGLGLASAFWVALNFYSLSLIHNSAQTLLIIWAVEASVVIPLYSLFRLNPDQCSHLKAIARGLLGLPAGGLLNALAAIVLGAPVGLHLSPQLLFMAHLGMIGIEYLLTRSQDKFFPANWINRFNDCFTCIWIYYWGMVWCLAHAS